MLSPSETAQHAPAHRPTKTANRRVCFSKHAIATRTIPSIPPYPPPTSLFAHLNQLFHHDSISAPASAVTVPELETATS
jgi:hypothetical protein